jgi:hypothetical protein
MIPQHRQPPPPPPQFVEASDNPNAPTLRAMLDDAAGNFTADGRSRSPAVGAMLRAGSSGSVAAGGGEGQVRGRLC